MRKPQNRHFYHFFCFPWGPPGAIALNVVWMKDNSMLTNCLAAYAHLTITVSEIERYICEKMVILSYPLAFDAFVRGGGVPLWHGKTRMASLPDGEKISKLCYFVLTWSTNVTDGQTDRRTDTAWQQRPRLCIASRGKNPLFCYKTPRTRDLKTARGHMMWVDYAILHGNGLAHLRPSSCSHRNGLARIVSVLGYGRRGWPIHGLHGERATMAQDRQQDGQTTRRTRWKHSVPAACRLCA